jgi:hypothetical protein
MLIPVIVTLLPSDDSPGAKLWVRAQDGSKRVWYKWYENDIKAANDAHSMRLAFRQVVAAKGLSATLQDAIIENTEIDTDDLDKFWTPYRIS